MKKVHDTLSIFHVDTRGQTLESRLAITLTSFRLNRIRVKEGKGKGGRTPREVQTDHTLGNHESKEVDSLSN